MLTGTTASTPVPYRFKAVSNVNVAVSSATATGLTITLSNAEKVAAEVALANTNHRFIDAAAGFVIGADTDTSGNPVTGAGGGFLSIDPSAGTINAIINTDNEISLQYTADSTAVTGLGAALTSANLATYVKTFVLGQNVTTWTELVAAAATTTANRLVVGSTTGNNAVLATRTTGDANDTAQAVPMTVAARALGSGTAVVAVLACKEVVGSSGGGNYTLAGASLVNNDTTNCRLAFQALTASNQSDVNAGTINAAINKDNAISLQYTADSTAVTGLGAALTSANLATHVKAFVITRSITTWIPVVAAAATTTANSLVVGATAGTNAVLATRTTGDANDTAQAVPMTAAAQGLGNGDAVLAVLACQEAVGSSGGGNYEITNIFFVNNDPTNCRLALKVITITNQSDANAGTIEVAINTNNAISLKYTADSTAVTGLGAALTNGNVATYVKAFVLGQNVTTWTEVVAAAATGTNNRLVVGTTTGNNAVLATRTTGDANDTAQAVPMTAGAQGLANGSAVVAVLACQEAVGNSGGGNYRLNGDLLVNDDTANCRLAFKALTASNQ